MHNPPDTKLFRLYLALNTYKCPCVQTPYYTNCMKCPFQTDKNPNGEHSFCYLLYCYQYKKQHLSKISELMDSLILNAKQFNIDIKV